MFFTNTSLAIFDITVYRNLMCHYFLTNQGFCLYSDFWKLFFFLLKNCGFTPLIHGGCVLVALHIFLTYYFNCQWFWWPISKCIFWHTAVWVILLSKLHIRNCVCSPWGASQWCCTWWCCTLDGVCWSRIAICSASKSYTCSFHSIIIRIPSCKGCNSWFICQLVREAQNHS